MTRGVRKQGASSKKDLKSEGGGVTRGLGAGGARTLGLRTPCRCYSRPISAQTASDRPGAGAPLSVRASTSQPRPRAGRGRCQFLGAWKARPQRGPPNTHIHTAWPPARRPHRSSGSPGSRRGSGPSMRGAPGSDVPGPRGDPRPWRAVPTHRGRKRAAAGLGRWRRWRWSGQGSGTRYKGKEPRRARLALPALPPGDGGEGVQITPRAPARPAPPQRGRANAAAPT